MLSCIHLSPVCKIEFLLFYCLPTVTYALCSYFPHVSEWLIPYGKEHDNTKLVQ
jgi:hypothetical protein